jgi:hypothetical protein
MKLITNTERASLNLSAKVAQLFYHDHHELNSTDQDYNATLSFRAGQRLSLSMTGSFLRDSRPDSVFYTSGLILNGSRRESSSEGVAANYLLSPTTTLGLRYDHKNEWFRSSSFADFVSDSAACRWSTT